MESLKVDEQLPSPPPYFLQGKLPSQFTGPEMISLRLKNNLCVFVCSDESQTGQDGKIYHIYPPFSPLPPPQFSFSPGDGSAQTHSPLTGTCSPNICLHFEYIEK